MSNNSAAPTRFKSFLLADCGSINTTVALLDVVEDSYRLIAQVVVPTTGLVATTGVDQPTADIVRGLQEAIGRLTQTTGRTLLTEQGVLLRPTRLNGDGVDQFVVVISAGKPLATLLVGLSEDVSLATSRRALYSNYVREVETFSLADERDGAEQIEALIASQPDLVMIAGGTDEGEDKRLLELVETVSLGMQTLSRSKRIQVVYGGNIKLRERVTQLLGEQAGLQVIDNIRPRLEVERLEEAINIVSTLYEELSINRLPGIRDLMDWAELPPFPTATAFAAMCRYFAALNQNQVLGVDLGAEQVSFVTADSEQLAVSIYAGLGMGSSLPHLLDHIDLAEVIQWLPTAVSVETLHDYIYHKSLHPQTIPDTAEALQMEQALARAVLQRGLIRAAQTWAWPILTQAPPCQMMLVRGSTLTHAAREGQIILMLLDALQPTGIFSVVLDRYGLLPSLGALSAVDPLPVIQTLESGVLTNLGWVVVPTGSGQSGQKILDVSMEMDQGQKVGEEVEYGSLTILPLRPNQTAKVTLKPTRRFDIGQGPGKERQLTIHGGTVGLVIDGRGRPLQFPEDDTARRTLIRQWLFDVGG
ncbi:MAG: glutamate mutase L [Chloroflexota bacterium]